MAVSQGAAAPVVVKLGGEVMRVGDDTLFSACGDVAKLAASGQPVVVVHGGGTQVTELQKRLGETPRIVAGRRITDQAALDAVKMAVCGKVNVDLCGVLLGCGAKPVGLHGASSCAIRAHKRPPRVVAGAGPAPIDFGHVGDVDGVNDELLGLLLAHNYVPVLACLGAERSGETFNINADIVANRVAIALGARALVLVSDVPGVLRDVSDATSRIARLTAAEGKAAIESGVVTKGMIPKLTESFDAIAEGVRAVHVVGRLSPGDLAREVNEPGSVGTVLLP
jgi:acetylglutamate kinase